MFRLLCSFENLRGKITISKYQQQKIKWYVVKIYLLCCCKSIFKIINLSILNILNFIYNSCFLVILVFMWCSRKCLSLWSYIVTSGAKTRHKLVSKADLHFNKNIMSINNAALKIYKKYFKKQELDNEMTICTVNFVRHNYAEYYVAITRFVFKINPQIMVNVKKKFIT